MVWYNIKGFRSREGPVSLPATCLASDADVRVRGLPHIVRVAPVRRPVAGSIVLHALLLAAALVLTRHYTLPIPGEPTAIALVFQQPAPPAAPATTLPAPPPPAVEPQAPPPTAAPAPPPPATQPPDLEVPLPPPTVEAPSPPLPLPPPPAPAPPQPVRPASPPRPAPRPTPSPVPPHPTAAAPAPAQPASTAPSSATASAAQPALSPNWRGALAAWLETHKTYPEQARRRGEQGRGSVRFTVDRSGQVLDVAIVSSTGSSILDDAIERMLRGAHVPPFPANMDETEVTVTVQIRYALE